MWSSEALAGNPIRRRLNPPWLRPSVRVACIPGGTDRGANHDDVRYAGSVDRIIADHREVEAVFKEIEGCGTPAKRHELVEHAIAELVRHSIGEEEYLYPAARKALPAGDDLANRKLREHTDAEWVMKRIEGLHADDTHLRALSPS